MIHTESGNLDEFCIEKDLGCIDKRMRDITMPIDQSLWKGNIQNQI